MGLSTARVFHNPLKHTPTCCIWRGVLIGGAKLLRSVYLYMSDFSSFTNLVACGVEAFLWNDIHCVRFVRDSLKIVDKSYHILQKSFSRTVTSVFLYTPIRGSLSSQIDQKMHRIRKGRVVGKIQERADCLERVRFILKTHSLTFEKHSSVFDTGTHSVQPQHMPWSKYQPRVNPRSSFKFCSCKGAFWKYFVSRPPASSFFAG